MIRTLLFYAKFFLPRLGISSEKGQGLTEYALIILLIALAIIGALTIVGDNLLAIYQYIVDKFPQV